MINPVNYNSNSEQIYSTKEKKNYKEETKHTKDENAVAVDIGKAPEQSTTYSKPAAPKINAEEIKKLWAEADKATQTLKSLVEDLLKRQGKKFRDVVEGREALVVDEKARAEAEALISEDGELGVKAVSARIVEFAKAISGNDKSKISELKEAIKEGFAESEKALGGVLPDISKKTYDEIMNQLDKWEKEE